MALLSDRDREIIRTRFEAELVADVALDFFTQGESPLSVPSQECPPCREEHALLDELVALSPKLKLRVHDFLRDRPAVEQFEIEDIPALVLSRNGQKGVRYFGLTSGYEFAALVEDIVDISSGKSALSAKTRHALAALVNPVHIRVFVTPT